MSNLSPYATVEMSPWFVGHAGGREARAGGHAMSGEERERLDTLLGTALVNADIRQRLLRDRDTSLFAAFSISEETQAWLRGLNATSLTDLAQAIAYRG